MESSSKTVEQRKAQNSPSTASKRAASADLEASEPFFESINNESTKGGYEGKKGHPRFRILDSLEFLPTYVRRGLDWSQMDFEYCFTQMWYLLYSPSKVYKLTSWRSQTKNQWARDDPAFLMVLLLMVATSSILHSVFLGPSGIGFLYVLRKVLVSSFLFFVTGLIAAFSFWSIATNYFKSRKLHVTDQEIEFFYAFDIHCNAFFPIVVNLYFGQFVLLPLLTHSTTSLSFVSLLLANSLVCSTFAYYFYISFLGYMFLPFLNKDKVTRFLYPIAVIGAVFLISLLARINLSSWVVSTFI